MIIERFRRQIEERRAKEYEQKPESVPPSVREILGDPLKSELLNLFLEKDEKPDLREKF